MQFEKATGIALRIIPYSRTSHIITWLTSTHGQLTTIAKGACRPKSAFLGQYDRLYTCELVYYAREGRSIHVLRECSPLDCRSRFRNDWRSTLCALYVTDLVYRTTMPATPATGIYRLTEAILDFLAENEVRPTVPVWFELQLLSRLGLAPQLAACARCGVAIDGSTPLPFSPPDGGLFCPPCATESRGAGRTMISPPVQAFLRSLQASDVPRLAHSTYCPREQLLASWQLLGVMLSEHLGEDPGARKEAYRTLFPPDPLSPRSEN